MITAPGLYDIPAADYHRDPCEVPSLSCTIARILVRRTPAHAYHAHPRFGAGTFEATKVMDDGSAVHAMFAEQPHLIETIRTTYGPKTKRKDLIGEPVRDYLTDAAKEERDEIRSRGAIPVLHHRRAELIRCYREGMRQFRAAEDGECFTSPGRSEVMAVAEEDGVWLRVLVDRLPNDPKLPPADLKCTEMSAAPGEWERRLQREYAFQDAFYRRVLHGAEGFLRPPMRFGVLELDPPHGAVIMAAAPSLEAIAMAEVDRAIMRWRRCMTTGVWPMYPPYTAWVEAPNWMTVAEDDAAMREEIVLGG